MATGKFNMVSRYLGQFPAMEGIGQLQDGQLLDRYARDRDEAAFELLVARHGPMVLDVCRRVLHRAEAVQDAFQATFLVFIQKAGSIRKPEQIGSWLYGVADRVANKAKTKATQRHALEIAAARQRPPNSAAQLGEFTLRQLFNLLAEALNHLPARYRAPLVLCYLQGMTHDEAAQHVGCSLATFDRRLHRGRVLLKTLLSLRGLTAPPAGPLLQARKDGEDAPENLRIVLYDGLGRVTVTFDPAGHGSTSSCGPAANQPPVTDALSNSTSFSYYDAAGLVTPVKDARN